MMAQMSERSGPVVIVMGVSGSGKSTVGSGLAVRLDWPYLEGDEFHLPESIDKMAAGMALDDEDRWPWLNRLAAEIDQAVNRHGSVVATCSALKRKYRDRLRQTIRAPVVFVHLIAETTNLKLRISARDRHYMPASLLHSQLQLLEPPGNDEHAIVLTNDTDVAGVVEAAYAWVLSLSDV
jgi:gluconokinase